MSKFKKVAAVAVMVGGMALGGGVSYACDGPLDDPSGVVIGNLQAVNCDQEFEGGAAFAPSQLASTDGNTQNIGNFCTVVGPVED
ncbi:hypothetical protein AB0D78_36445 [Streptomyces avermitilis]|uniref:hypothetical protein n=1 Tax=Streptomyces avermitilis TaxID=33903 RepID=UPI00339EFE3B